MVGTFIMYAVKLMKSDKSSKDPKVYIYLHLFVRTVNECLFSPLSKYSEKFGLNKNYIPGQAMAAICHE